MAKIIIELVIDIMVLGLGLRVFIGSYGKLKSVDEEIAEVVRGMKFGNEKQRHDYAIFMYRVCGFFLTVGGILGLTVTIFNKGEPLIFK